MSGKTSKKRNSKSRPRRKTGGKTRAHCVIARSESGMLSDLLKPQPAVEHYDTALIDAKTGGKFNRAATAGSSFSIAAGVAATTMAGILSHLR